MNTTEGFNFSAKACCSWENEVWVAKQSGDLAVVDVTTNEILSEIMVTVDGPGTQIVRLTAVEGEVWAATLEGKLLSFDATHRKFTQIINIPGSEKKASITSIFYDGVYVLVASEIGRVYVMDPTTKKQMGVLATEAPCTAAVTMDSHFVGGDKEGRLYVWDVSTLDCLVRHEKSKSEVRHLLYEDNSRTVWVARENGNLDVYSFAANQLVLTGRAPSIGKVTGLESVTGKIMASTFEKKIVVLCSQTGRILDTVGDSHKHFIQGITKVQRRETVKLWSYSGDEGVFTWELEGNFTKVNNGSRLSQKKISNLSLDRHLQQISENAQLRVNVQEEKANYVNFRDDLRRTREEAQELRLRLIKLQEEVEVKKEEVVKGEKRIKELEDECAKHKKDATEFSEKVSTVEKERTMLQTEVGTLKEDLSKTRTEVSGKITENSKLSQEVSLAKTEKNQMEQRLHDAESKLATIEGENTRLCRSIGSVTAAQNAEKDVQNQILKGSEQSRDELERVRKLNKVLSSALASMEYTIRKKEEEEKDLTALLNAYRRKVADRVSDPHLSALLVSTMVRNPSRFDLECDDVTKGELLDRNGPFIQFIHSLRDTDFEAYTKLMDYLQQSSEGTLSSEANELLDRFLQLATTEGTVSGEVMSSFKRSLPSQLNSNQIASQLPPSLGSLHTGGTTAVSGGASDGKEIPVYHRGGIGTANTPKEEDLVTTALLREMRSQKTVDDNYVKEHQVLFEFILQTRRGLVERLALLQKRTVSAKQVVEALSIANPSSPLKKNQSLQNVFVGIIQELVELTTDVVKKYFTNAERQRLNIQ